MIDRRMFLRGCAASMALVGMRAAHAAPAAGTLHTGTAGAARRKGMLPIRGRGGFARLGKAIKPLHAAVFSIANANDRYVAVSSLAFVPNDSLYLRLGDDVLAANSWGTGFGDAKGSVSFDVDRATADEIAALWRVTRRDRTPLGTGLVGKWGARAQPFTLGKRMEIALTIEHTGGDPVGVTVGGRQRGPRDNRFHFTVEQAGRALPEIDAPDFGGVMSYRQLTAGESFELPADLNDWVTIDKPGAYLVRCRHEVELVPKDQSPQWPDHGHETWDLAFDALLEIRVT